MPELFTPVTDEFLRWAITNLSSTEIKVFLTLLTFRNLSTGKCHPSYSTIAKYVDCSQRTVERAIQTLRNLEVISGCPKTKFSILIYKGFKLIAPNTGMNSRKLDKFLTDLVQNLYLKD